MRDCRGRQRAEALAELVFNRIALVLSVAMVLAVTGCEDPG
jgi:hypothetical protein